MPGPSDPGPGVSHDPALSSAYICALVGMGALVLGCVLCLIVFGGLGC
jgi:hypothetical protein